MLKDSNPDRVRDVEAPLALVCLGEVAWDRSWKRNQSMAFELSRQRLFDRLVFINPNEIWIRKELFGRGRSWPERLRATGEMFPKTITDDVKICSFTRFMPLKGKFRRLEKVEEFVFQAMVDRLLGGRPYVLLNNHPCFYSRAVLDRLMSGSQLSIYDVSDDFVEFTRFEDEKEKLLASIEYCSSSADIVFFVNEHLRGKYGHLNASNHVVPNSTNFSNFDRELFRRIPFMDKLRENNAVILGHTGTINSARVDYDLLEHVLVSKPGWQVVFVGSCDPSFRELVDRHANLHLHDQVPYDELPDFISYFDAAIIPFQVNEHTRGNDLLKFNDYLAMGRAVVSTDMGGVRRYGELVRVASTPTEFLACVESALGEDPRELRQARMDAARERSWNVRAAEIEELLVEHLTAPSGNDRDAGSKR